jgi:putative flippase GtrA
VKNGRKEKTMAKTRDDQSLADRIVPATAVATMLMVAPIVLILGLQALLHFVFWEPYEGFPWFELRVAAAIGFVLNLVIGFIYVVGSD